MPLDPDTFFRAYVDDRRQQSIASFDRDLFQHLLRYTARPPNDEGMVLYATLRSGAETAQISEQVAYFESIGQGFEWKVYALDQPHDLRERLLAQGFVADDEETFMAYPLASLSRRATTPCAACEVERIDDERGVRDVIAIQQVVWNMDFEWLRTRLVARLDAEPDTLSLYCAYRGGRPVGSGWTDFPPGSRYPELHGGAVLEEARGLGVYSALFTVRLQEALRRGHAVVCVDASSMSQPILERIGFEPICSTVPMRRAVNAKRHDA